MDYHEKRERALDRMDDQHRQRLQWRRHWVLHKATTIASEFRQTSAMPANCAEPFWHQQLDWWRLFCRILFETLIARIDCAVELPLRLPTEDHIRDCEDTGTLGTREPGNMSNGDRSIWCTRNSTRSQDQGTTCWVNTRVKDVSHTGKMEYRSAEALHHRRGTERPGRLRKQVQNANPQRPLSCHERSKRHHGDHERARDKASQKHPCMKSTQHAYSWTCSPRKAP